MKYAVSLGLALTLFASAATAASNGTKTYDILKEGESIGSHSFTFSASGQDTQVKVKTDTKAKVLFMTFVYNHERTENWSADGKLISLVSKTNDDGTPHTVAMQANGNAIDMTVDGKSSAIGMGDLPVTLWNAAILDKTQLYSAVDGQVYNVQVKEIGTKMIKIRGRTVPARNFKMTGDLERELWYAPNGDFLKTRFKKKGYVIEWVLK